MNRFKKIQASRVISYMVFDNKNLSSIKNCLRGARENARAERNSIPTEIFESLNSSWLTFADFDPKKVGADEYRDFFDWVKDRVHAVRGLTYSLMLQTEGFHFNNIGTFLERGDNTARLLEVRYHELLVDGVSDDKAADYYHWGALLRALSAFKSYRMVYHDTLEREKVAELLMLNPHLPRSLNYCSRLVAETLSTLAPKTRCAVLAERLHKRFAEEDILKVTRNNSLHSVLEIFSRDSAALSDQIAKDFLFSA